MPELRVGGDNVARGAWPFRKRERCGKAFGPLVDVEDPHLRILWPELLDDRLYSCF
jgi:hypothetical protein